MKGKANNSGRAIPRGRLTDQTKGKDAGTRNVRALKGRKVYDFAGRR